MGPEFRLSDELAIDLDSLTQVDQVRGGIQPDSESTGLQHAGEHGRSRALALGPGNMNGIYHPVR